MMEGRRFISGGFPYGGDGLSNLIPAWLVRHELTSGDLPIYTELWYGGEYLFANPLFKGFYPLWWPTMIPGVPMELAVTAILSLHVVGTGLVAYWVTSRSLPPRFALPLSFVLSLPVIVWGAHTEKLLGWPYFVLVIGAVAPDYIRRFPRRSGLTAGAGVGVMLLVGDIYHAAYAGLLVTSVGVATVGFDYLRGLALGGLAGIPKVVSLLPTLVDGSDRPGVSFFAFPPQEILLSLWGVQLTSTGISIGVPKYRFATVGLPITIVALAAVYWAYKNRLSRHYVAGVLAASLVGALLAGFPPLYWLPIPGIDILRTAGRATLLVGVGTILLTWLVCTERNRLGITRQRLLVAVLALSVLNVALVPAAGGGGAVNPTVGREVAATLQSEECTPVWLEIHPRVENGVGTGPYHKQISYALAEAGIPATATSYGRIGQDYGVRSGGDLTFEALIIGGRLNASDTTKRLSGGWHRPYRGSINVSEWDVLDRVSTDRGPIYIYSNGSCGA
jgi:hypothetical protein